MAKKTQLLKPKTLTLSPRFPSLIKILFSRFQQSNARSVLGRFLLLPTGTNLLFTCLICMLTNGCCGQESQNQLLHMTQLLIHLTTTLGVSLSSPFSYNFLYSLWHKMFGLRHQEDITQMTISMKAGLRFLFNSDNSHYILSSDFFLSTELIPKKRQNKWIDREGFITRKILILKWIFLGNVLTMGYKCTLLSTLIPIRYESTIDTLSDLDQSGLPLVVHRSSAPHHAFANDPRQIMKRIYNRSILHDFTGIKSLEKYLKMYLNIIVYSIT